MQQITSLLNIEVAYAYQEHQTCIALKVQAPCTIEQAIEQSGILTLFLEIDLDGKNPVGIYNQIKSRHDLVEDGDRIEIYRPLRKSAMAARRERLKQQKVKSG